jgi:hypothetical protein
MEEKERIEVADLEEEIFIQMCVAEAKQAIIAGKVTHLS